MKKIIIASVLAVFLLFFTGCMEKMQKEDLKADRQDDLKPVNETSTDIDADDNRTVIVSTDEFSPDGYFLSTYGDFSTEGSLDEICRENAGEVSNHINFSCKSVSYSRSVGCSPEKLNYRDKGVWKYRYTIHPNRVSCYAAGQGICGPQEYLEWVECSI